MDDVLEENIPNHALKEQQEVARNFRNVGIGIMGLHDAFIKYVQSSPAFSDDDHERAWLIRVTVNRCRDLLRRRSIRAYVNLDEIGEIPDEEAQYEDSGIIASVSALPDKYKSVIILHYLEGYSVEKTASILGLSESAVKMRLSRGREMLKKTIEKEGAQ